MLRLADDGSLAMLATHLRAAIAHETAVRKLEVGWRTQESSKTPNAEEMRVADTELDAGLSSLDAQFTASRATADGSVRAKLDALRLEVFPDGLNGIVAAPCDVARVEVQRVLDVLETTQARELADSLLLETYKTVLRARLARFNSLRPQSGPPRDVRSTTAPLVRGRQLLLLLDDWPEQSGARIVGGVQAQDHRRARKQETLAASLGGLDISILNSP